MKKALSWEILLGIAVVSFILKFLIKGDMFSFLFEVIGLISLVSGIAGFIKNYLLKKKGKSDNKLKVDEKFNLNKNNLPWVILAIVIVIIIGYFSLNFQDKDKINQPILDNPIIDVRPNTKIEVTTIKVAKFYDGEDGYSVSIPSGNRSTCVWNWEGGSGAIPDSTTTYANTATEKHTIVYYGGTYNYKINCFDDFGNQYLGVFPFDN